MLSGHEILPLGMQPKETAARRRGTSIKITDECYIILSYTIIKEYVITAILLMLSKNKTSTKTMTTIQRLRCS